MQENSHLQRLNFVWERHPVYFVTTCTAGRRRNLDTADVAEILRAEWRSMRDRHRWAVGRYVIMPDHVHVFMCPENGRSPSLAVVVAKWKEWTAKRALAHLGLAAPFWQPEFFDHLMRSEESREAKWEYVKQNPVRAKLVSAAEDWPFAGAIDFE